jgi:hypothetical protein
VIYQITNYTENKPNFVCPDQTIIDQGISYGYVGVFSIGTQSDADTILAINQQNWLTQNIELFTVNKDIDPDPIQTTWIVCDLNTELQNTDVDYNIFDVVNGYYTLTTGLDNAKVLLEQTKQNWLVYYNLDTYIEFNEFSPPKKVAQPIATGVQTL